MNFKELAVGIILAALALTLMLTGCNAQTNSPEFSVDSTSVDKWMHQNIEDVDPLHDMHLSKEEMTSDTIQKKAFIEYADWSGKRYEEFVNVLEIHWYCREGNLAYFKVQFFTEVGRIIPWKLLEYRERHISKL